MFLVGDLGGHESPWRQAFERGHRYPMGLSSRTRSNVALDSAGCPISGSKPRRLHSKVQHRVHRHLLRYRISQHRSLRIKFKISVKHILIAPWSMNTPFKTFSEGERNDIPALHRTIRGAALIVHPNWTKQRVRYRLPSQRPHRDMQ